MENLEFKKVKMKNTGCIETTHTIPSSREVGIKLHYNAKVTKDSKLTSVALGNFIF